MGIIYLLSLYFSVFLISVYILTGRILHRLRNLPPTPFPTLPVIGHLYLVNQPFHKTLSKLSLKHGPVIFLQLGRIPVVVVSSPSTIQECLTTNDVIFANRPKFLSGKYFGYDWTSMVWSSYVEHLRHLRRIASHEVLSSISVQLLSEIRTDEVRSLVRKLFGDSVKDPDKLVDLRVAVFDLIFNVMTRMIAGKRYFGENVDDIKEGKDFREMLLEMNELNERGFFLTFFPFMRLFGLNDVEKKMKDVQEKRDKFMQNVIDKHRDDDDSGSEKRNKTMLSALLALHENQPDSYSEETMKSLMLLLIDAGSDTTATTMEWAMACVIDSPDVQKKAQDEIESVVGQDRFLVESDLPLLPYLQCIIKETLRLHPAAPLLAPHKASLGCVVGGFKIPAETVLFVNAWEVQNSPNHWDNPEKFRPERFQGSDIGTKVFLPFGLGRRACPGENLGMHVLGLALGTLLQCFHWKMEEEGKVMDFAEGYQIPMYKAHPLVAKCSTKPNIIKLLSQL